MKTDGTVQEEAVSPDRRRVLIVANPYSGMRGNRRRVETLVAALGAQGLQGEIAWGREERAAWLADPARLAACRCIVAAGGDGTLLELINLKPTIPVAVLPLGNKNLFARQFGFTRAVRPLARAIAAGRVHAVDLGSANGRRFSLLLSIGFDAEVVHRLALWRSRQTGLKRVHDISYVPHVLTAMYDYPYSRVEVEADGVRVAGVQVFIFNLPQYGVPMFTTPDVVGDDGLLDWLVLERPGFLSLLESAWTISRAAHRGRPDIHSGRARRIRLTAERPLPVQIDGDPAGCTPVEVEVLPRELKVVRVAK